MEIPNIEMQRPCPTPRSLTTFSERDEIQGIAFVISDAIGVGAKENIAKWRINIVCEQKTSNSCDASYNGDHKII